MIAKRSPRRCASTPSLLLGLVLATAASGACAEVTLRAFTASYKIFQGGMHIANSELRLEPSGEDWRWRMTSRARGVFSLFIDRQPYAETRFSRGDDGIRLQEIVISDENDAGRRESARFDWQRGRVSILRRGKRRELPLEAGVFDYHSIHLLAAAMRRDGRDEAMIDFYRKGKLSRSRLVYAGEATVDIGGESRAARVYEQILLRSGSRVKYYYDADRPLLPLRIERLEAGESPSIMVLETADWSF